MSSTHVINDYIAGSIGGAAGVVAGHPFDTVKVQIQTQEFGGKFSNLMDAYRTVKNQSLAKGFFRGLSWPLLSYGGMNAAFFGFYGLTLKKMDYVGDLEKPEYLAIAAASAVATVPADIIACPVEVIKITLQSQIPHKQGAHLLQQKFYKGPLEASRDIIRTSGLKGMFRGLSTQIARDTPANMLYMVSFTTFQYFGKMLLPSVPSQAVNFLGGGIAGVLSWSIIMPFDVVKSKLQADPAKQRYKGFWDCARKIHLVEGNKAFFMGFIPVALRAFPVNAITLMVYIECLLWLNNS